MPVIVLKKGSEMPEEQFSPLNELETALLDAMQGNIPLQAFLRKLLESGIAIPSQTEVLADGSGMTPVIYNQERTPMIAVFSDMERAKSLSKVAPYCLVMNGKDLLSRMPPHFGLVLNPGYSKGFELSPPGIKEILRDLVADNAER